MQQKVDAGEVSPTAEQRGKLERRGALKSEVEEVEKHLKALGHEVSVPSSTAVGGSVVGKIKGKEEAVLAGGKTTDQKKPAVGGGGGKEEEAGGGEKDEISKVSNR